MAKLPVTVAVTVTLTILLLLLTVSQARIPSDLLESDVIERELPNSRPDPDVSSILRLPSDSVNDESHSNEPAGNMPESEQITVTSVPLSFVRFRPINRHFPIRSTRFRFRNCRRRQDQPFFKPIRPQLQQHRVEIPYRNDIILATGENSDFDSHPGFDPVMLRHGRFRRIPARGARFHDRRDDHEHVFPESVTKHRQRFGKEKFKKHLHRRDDEEKKREEEGRKEKGGFVKRIRKFLDHYPF